MQIVNRFRYPRGQPIERDRLTDRPTDRPADQPELSLNNCNTCSRNSIKDFTLMRQITVRADPGNKRRSANATAPFSV